MSAEPARTEAILDAWKAGRISSAIAVMELLIASGNRALAEQLIRERTGRDGICYDELHRLLCDHREGCECAVSIARRFGASASPASALERVASTKERFDESVAECEEASVALYSLGDAELLRAATEEIVNVMRGWELLGQHKDVLQIGCGIGRFEAAISPYVRSAIGVDIAPKMIEAARRRTARLTNVRFELGNGFDLAAFDRGTFDVVYAVDSMPYIVEAGPELVDAHFREAARVLRQNGELVIFEFSYRGDLEQDRADVRRLSAEYGFDVVLDGIAPFTLWNGRVFRLPRRRRAPAQGIG